VAVKQREELQAHKGIDLGRVTRRGMSSLSYAILLVVAVTLVLTISMNFRYRWDATKAGRLSLTPQTLAILEGLEEDVTLYPLFTTGNPQREGYWYMLQLYRQASDRVSVEFIDPVARPGRVKALGLEASEESSRRDGVTVVVQGDRHILFSGTKEDNVTNAIHEIGSSERRVVGFVRGYAERSPESGGANGMSRAVFGLRGEYYDAMDVHLAQGVPDIVTVLILAGPRAPIPESDLARLSQWLADGGRLLVLLDPGAETGLNSVLERWGLRFNDGLIIEPQRNVNADPQFLKVTSYTEHEVVKGFGKNLPIALPVTGPVSHFEPGDPLIFRDEIALTSDFSVTVAEDGTRSQGPFPVAVASWVNPEVEEAQKTRIVLVGDSDFATNHYLAANANMNFFLNCLGWLSREKGLVSIRRQILADQTLDIGFEHTRLVLLASFGMPALVLLTGIVVFVRRRRL
jgi:hypothetical protein